MCWTIISTIIIGGIVGALGRLLLPGKQSMPLWLTVVVGIIAAFLGLLVARLFGVDVTDGVDWIRWAITLVFAVAGVALVGKLGIGNKSS